jgi:SAM-dependent methyltransferase
VFDNDRCDLDMYEAIVHEVGAATVVDIGCGTGSLAVRLAEQGVRLLGVDPAGASLEVARGKPGADRVEWLHGDARALNGRSVGADLAVMTGNVAQVFVEDADWAVTLDAVRGCLRAEGWFVFETRRAEARDWQRWDIAPTTVILPDGKSAVVSRTVTAVELPLVTFESCTVLDGHRLISASTLRFRDPGEIEVTSTHTVCAWWRSGMLQIVPARNSSSWHARGTASNARTCRVPRGRTLLPPAGLGQIRSYTETCWRLAAVNGLRSQSW